MIHMKKIIIFILIFFTALSITSCGIAIVNDGFVITDGDNNKGISIEDDDSDDDTIVDNNENEVDDTKTINNEDEASDTTSNNNEDTTVVTDNDDSEEVDNSSRDEDEAIGYTKYDHTSEALPYYFLYNEDTYDFDIYYKDNTLLDDYLVYSSSDQYDSFISLDNAENMRLAYLNALAKSLVISLYDDYSPKTVNTSSNSYYSAYTIKTTSTDYTITIEEAVTIWAAVEADNPLFYWIENSYLYSTTQIYVIMADSFIDYSDRIEANNDIIEGINNIASNMEGLSEYDTIKYAYTYVISNTSYAYDEDGSASSKVEAHSVVGFFQGENVVCEGYAKVLQIIYNYVGITNYYIRGYVGSTSAGHAWNYVCYNSKWYWMDATNDDEGTYSNYSLFLLGSNKMSKYNYYTYDDTLGATYQGGLPTLNSKSYGNSSIWPF